MQGWKERDVERDAHLMVYSSTNTLAKHSAGEPVWWL